MKKKETFIDALNYRRSVRVYDENKGLNSGVVKQCIQQATLAPNSSNMQLWEFHHITSKPVLEKLAVACLGQSAATTAKEMVAIVVRKDVWKKRAKANATHLLNTFGNKPKGDYSSREKCYHDLCYLLQFLDNHHYLYHQ